uniref:AAA+ ATPase domain-containing protein n=1 Tax=viral metagenome TaxID=1070528 RepID=A0A6C0C2T1_9ZZZZ
MNEKIPWVEKYRPREFNKIVLEPINKELLNNIIEKNHFPNLLFYGPPGTGKTTTIINLIDKYHKKNNILQNGLSIHLNASDDRGIDIIRNQINQFVNTKSLFKNGIKFVILDEIDYMTKNAQQALKYLIQQYSENVRFCLICNYISRIDLSLQNEFIKLKFCQLPITDINRFLNNIILNEKISITENQIKAIQKMFGSDIRSMINFLQSNHNHHGLNIKIISNECWEELINNIITKEFNVISNILNEMSNEYNIKKTNLIINFLTYLIKNKSYIYSDDWMKFIEMVMHNINIDAEYIINYSTYQLKNLLSK